MLEKYFAELIQCAGTVYLAISIFIALIKAPSDETYKPYRTAGFWLQHLQQWL